MPELDHWRYYGHAHLGPVGASRSGDVWATGRHQSSELTRRTYAVPLTHRTDTWRLARRGLSGLTDAKLSKSVSQMGQWRMTESHPRSGAGQSTQTRGQIEHRSSGVSVASAFGPSRTPGPTLPRKSGTIAGEIGLSAPISPASSSDPAVGIAAAVKHVRASARPASERPGSITPAKSGGFAMPIGACGRPGCLAVRLRTEG